MLRVEVDHIGERPAVGSDPLLDLAPTHPVDVVEQGLKLIILRQNQQAIRGLRGKIKWEGSLDEMRTDNDIS